MEELIVPVLIPNLAIPKPVQSTAAGARGAVGTVVPQVAEEAPRPELAPALILLLPAEELIV
jgi:hypothetical protein